MTTKLRITGEKLIAFLDESGDHSLKKIDPTSPHFMVGLAVFKQDAYIEAINAVNELKLKYWPHEGIVLHAYEIRKGKGQFGNFNVQSERERFMASVGDLLSALDFRLFVYAIDKQRLVDKYPKPRDPYDLSMAFILQRLLYDYRGQKPECIRVIAESRGNQEDEDLQGNLYKVIAEGDYYNTAKEYQALNLKLEFMKKTDNVAGLQIVDLAISPILSKIRNPDKPNKPYEIVEPKIRRSPNGPVLCIFPGQK